MAGGLSFQKYKRLSAAKAHEFSLIDKFHGYRNREDKTNLPIGTLITGSQNVLTNVSGRIGVRQGYALDGSAASGSLSGSAILSAFDWTRHTGNTINLRAGSLTSALNDGKLEYRYVSGTTVTWRTLQSSLTSVAFNFTDYWDQTNFQSLLLWVNASSQITEWTGGITTVSSSAAGTITKTGTNTWAQDGFYTTGTHSVTVNGIDYQATGGWGTTTLTGVTPSAAGLVAGDIVHQTPEITVNGSLTSFPSGFTNDLIGNLRNQIYVGSLTNNSVYISKVNNYKDYSYTSPTRIVGEGAIVTMDGTATALIPQEDRMYLAAGKDQWYETKFTLSADLTKEAFEISRLKTTSLQGTQSQALTTKIKNNVVFVSNEPIVESLGRQENIFAFPNLTDLSFPIVNDMNGYSFTNGSVFYFKNFIYISVPTSGVVLIYNMTNPANPYWEAPQILPISRFYVVSGVLYGHSYNTSESYKLFTGYNDNNNFIDAKAVFSYEQFGTRSSSKSGNAMYVEGYISSNTNLTLGLNYDLDGCQTATTYSISGSDDQIVCLPGDLNSLGKESLGKLPLGGNLTNMSTLPPKFRGIKTFPRIPFFEQSTTFESNGIDQNWEIICFGLNATPTSEDNSSITE